MLRLQGIDRRGIIGDWSDRGILLRPALRKGLPGFLKRSHAAGQIAQVLEPKAPMVYAMGALSNISTLPRRLPTKTEASVDAGALYLIRVGA